MPISGFRSAVNILLYSWSHRAEQRCDVLAEKQSIQQQTKSAFSNYSFKIAI